MTKILLSAIVTDMRNSTAGTTFTKNRYGNVMKKKQTPVKQNTDYQNYWRQTQAGISKSWKTLTDSERQTWIDGSSNFPFQDNFGNTFYLSGFSLYQKLNLNLRIIGENPISTCPAPASPPAMNDFGVFVGWNSYNNYWTIDVYATSESSTDGFYYVLYATQPASAGKMVIGKTIYFVEYWDAPGESADVGNNFFRFLGTPAAGQKCFFQVFIMDVASGQRGVSLTTSVIFPNYITQATGSLVSGAHWVYNLVMSNGATVIPDGYIIDVYHSVGVRPAPANPSGLTYLYDTSFLEGTPINPLVNPTTQPATGNGYAWWRIDYRSESSSNIISKNYILILF
jgi:hypothetical protein